MNIGQSLLPEFDAEMQNTRKVLDLLPDAKWSWKPAEKSGTVGWYAQHIATLPGFTTMTIKTAEFDYAPVGGKSWEPPKVENRADALNVFDKESAEARAALAQVSDADIMANWRLLGGGHEVLSMPRIAVLRSVVMNHLIHHRGQLTVYLRLLGVPMPGLYGPSGDEVEMKASA